MMQNLSGQSITRYHILEQLGEGGMATVYKAYDTRLERDVAFKVLRTDLFGQAVLDQVLKRFEREAKSLAKLKHPNIVNILDFGEHEGMPYLVMEYLPGGTLKQKLGQAIPWQDAVHILLPVARGLSYAHQHGIIHRDVKPANILIDENNAPILTDFGIAKLLEGTEGHTLTGSGVGVGTPEYMAPEQGIGASAIDARADIYSLGIVLYEMVTGRKPYIADTPMAVVLKQMTDPLPRPTDFVPDLPEAVEHLLIKALAKKPEDRYENMNSLITAMEGMLTAKEKVEIPVPVKQVKKQVPSRVKPSPKVIRATVGIVGALFVIVLGFIMAPRIGDLTANPALTNTLKPSTTVTLPATVTENSIPTITLTVKPTRTARPTSTATPLPAWVTDFAQPILTAIANHPPTIQDDFNDNSGGWIQASYCDRFSKMKFVDGELNYICTAERSKMAYTNFVLEIDTRFLRGSSDSRFSIYYRKLYSFVIHIDGSMEISRLDDPTRNIPWKANAGHQTNHILMIVRGNQFAFYVNNIPVYFFEDAHFFTREAISFDANHHPMYDANYPQIALDNLKIWDLENIPDLP